MKGIEFNGKHSYKDYGLAISSSKIGDPSKVKITEQVPFSNTTYDFSGLYGGQSYTERPLDYTFSIIGRQRTREEFYNIKTAIVNWLSTGIGKGKLKDDAYPYYYFLAELVEASDYEYYINTGGTLSVTFTAYSFKISELPEGNDIWDSFNFMLDYVQDTSFEVVGEKEITLLNVGISLVYPKIITSASMQIVKGETTYNVPVGSTTSLDFSLSPGENLLKIIGTGTISFEFYKELI